MLDAMVPARFPPEKALPARFEAWLNLSHREKARVFMIVRTRAMTCEEELQMLVLAQITNSFSHFPDVKNLWK